MCGIVYRSVPQDWKDALLIPVPKKGDLSLFDNWRGISLLEVVGKVFAKIIQRRLQVLVEDVVTDSQCGFRSSRGCADMVTLISRPQYQLLFVDLRKAYDSVPQSAMWLALQKYGIPDTIVDLVRGLHEHMEATVSVAGESAQIQVSNGLWQGCVLAPTLFLLCWRARCASLGVKLLYKCGRKLVGERTREPISSLFNELCFADDAVITASTREDITKATMELQQVTAECGLTISIPKTKLMVAGTGIIESDVAPLCIGSSVVDTVPSFRYLGSVVESHGWVMLDLDDKIARASRAFGALQKPVFRDGSLSLVTKKVVYQTVVLGILLYAAETWPAKQKDIRRLEGFHHRCLQSILGICRMQQCLQHISNEKLRQWFGIPTSLEVMIACRRLQWL